MDNLNQIEEDIRNPDTDGKEFAALGKKYFQVDGELTDFWTRSKNILDFNSIKGENSSITYFLNLEFAPEYFIYPSPLNHYIKNFLKFRLLNNSRTEQLEIVEEYYRKWLKNKIPKEKRYFARSILNIVDKENISGNFYTDLIASMIYIFDPEMKDLTKAETFLSKANSALQEMKIKAVYKNELCDYINLIQGLYSYNAGDLFKAENHFTRIVGSASFATTAVFYKILINLKRDTYNEAEELLKKLYELDNKFLCEAIETYNVELFQFLLKNLSIKNLFYFKECSVLTPYIKGLFSFDVTIMKKVKDICLAINNTDFIFKDKEEIEKKILFIKNILSVDEFSNPLFLSIIPFTANMLIGIFNEIIDKINFFFIEKLKLSIAPFDRDLENTIKTSAEIIREFELSKTTLKELLESELKKKEEQSAKSVASVEYKINSLHEEGKYNPVNSFKSIMTLNGVVSFFVFLLGGCAGYNKTSIKSTDEYNIIAVTMLITAIKWGIYTFVVGLFMSGIGSLYTLFKNVVRKQQLVLLLKKVKDSLEIEKERVRSKYAAKEVLLNENYKQLTDENSKSVDRIKSRKAELESKLKAEYDIEKSVIILPLQTSIDSLANIVQHI